MIELIHHGGNLADLSAVASHLAGTLGVAFSKAEYPLSCRSGGHVHVSVSDVIVHDLAPYPRLLFVVYPLTPEIIKRPPGFLPVAVAVETVILQIKSHGLLWVRPWPIV